MVREAKRRLDSSIFINFVVIIRCLMRLNVLVLIIFIASKPGFGQGCSDAGFCTMGAMKPDQPYNKNLKVRLNSMDVSLYRGTTTLTPIVYVATLDMNFSLTSRTTLQVKLPLQGVEGALATTSGMGDISLCLTRSLKSTDRFDLQASLGTKIPTNQSDKSVNGLPLPMYYQTSLGTYDLIAGMSLINRRWLFATGIQIPLNQNSNQFVWSAWDGTEEEAYVNRYNQSKDLRRGIDVMLRVERNWRFARYNFSLGLLPIYRITRDEFTKSGPDAGSPEVRVKPDANMGLALSAIGTMGYNFDVRSGLKLLVGHKLVQRSSNPDGLSRELVMSLTYSYRFTL